ncbi:MAG: anthranilate synthase component I [Candidatus Omnitrophica bacterium]|nr:anthranilate synthase component I [Candidatus Omnitrophota bacterium]MBU1933045.1 anthranilate synthase component I [Candidatus Omnitrophota bacterium]
MYYPSKKEFLKLAKRANVIPVYGEILGDQLTPVSAFLSVRNDYSYLLESVEGEEKIARFSFIGIEPSLIFKSKGNSVELTESGKTRKFTTDIPLRELKRIMNRFKPAVIKGLPRFSGGMVGYMGYDVVRFFEDIPDNNPDDLKIPDSIFMLADSLIIFDHSTRRIKVVSNAYNGIAPFDVAQGRHSAKRIGQVYDETVKKIEEIIEKLNTPLKERKAAAKKKKPHAIKSNFTKKRFESLVRKAKEYIRAGDIIQVVPSQRFRTKLNCEPFDVYRSLRSLNPSPYMYYLDFDELQLVGSSPELLVRCENGIVETRPIAGTRPRGRNEAEDKKLEKELLTDAKERAEHVMLVDLGRNDIGRVCKPGSVRVTDFMFVEKYSHVMHIVSNCRGVLAKDKNAFDVLRACFPAGTVSGAPKIRAMEIIDELENTKRSYYAGAVGYFSFSGNMDTCITIRTMLVKGRDAYIQAGGGIVADSIPSREYQETVNKAKAMLKAIEAAEEGLL